MTMKHIQSKTQKQLLIINIIFLFIISIYIFLSFNLYELICECNSKNFNTTGNIIEKTPDKYDLTIYEYSLNLKSGYIGIYDKKHNIIHYKKYNITSFHLIFLILSFVIVFIWIFIVYNMVSKSEEEKYLLKATNLESLATQNSMSVLTENIHHELNSPLNVIKLKFRKIIEELNDNDIVKNNIDLINMSLDQISTILINMSNFKSLKYSNGNKNLYEIIEGSFRMIKVVVDNEFSFTIDERFKMYKINHSYGLKNADVVSIFINFVKNSLEANATHIDIKIENEKEEYLLINITDNGNGIPKNMRNNIFTPNKSSKDDNDLSLRGNGLFLVQNLLKMFGGDVRLKKTELGEGTEFVIKIPVKKLKSED